MNANNEFDKLIKEKLTQNLPSAPKDAKAGVQHLLINKGLIKKNDSGRKSFYVGFSVIAFIVVLTATVFKLNFSNEKSKVVNRVSNEKSVFVKANSDLSDNKKSVEQNGSGFEEVVNDNSSEQSLASNESGDKKSEAFNQGESKTKSNSLSASDKKLSSEQSAATDLSKKSSAGKSISSSNLNDVKKKSRIAKSDSNVNLVSASSKSVLEKEKRSAEPNQNLDLEKNSGKNSEKESSKLANINSERIINSDSSDSNYSTANSNFALSTTDSSAINSSYIDTSIVNSDKINSATTDSIKTDSLNSKKSVSDSIFNFSYSAELFGGIQQTYMTGNGNSTSSSGSTQNVSNSEWNTGLKLNLFYKKHFTFGVGINYSIHHSEIFKEYETFILDSNGTTTLIIPARLYTDFNVTEIPLLLGYYFEVNKFAFHLESGISFSTISNAHSILKIDGSNLAIDNFTLVSPVKSYSNFIGQISILYSLGKHFQIFLQPSYNVGLTEIFKEVPDKKINVISGRAGVRFNFH